MYASGAALVSISLSVTSKSAGSGFYGDILIGDPPAGSTHAPGAGSNAFADWAHLLGATRQQSGDLAITLDPGDSLAGRTIALAALAQSDARLV